MSIEVNRDTSEYQDYQYHVKTTLGLLTFVPFLGCADLMIDVLDSEVTFLHNRQLILAFLYTFKLTVNREVVTKGSPLTRPG